jgi:hypothetical protein
MKKQLLIAAVAATMATATMADLSITGDYEVKIKHTSGAAVVTGADMDLKISGKSGGKTVTATFGDLESGDALTVGQLFATTDVEGFGLKVGTYKTLTGNGMTYKKTNAARFGLTTKVAGVGVGVTHTSGNANASLTLSGTVGGMKVKLQNALNDGRTLSVSGDVAGIALAVENNDNTTAFSLTKEISGVNFTYASIEADAATATQNDGIFGDITGAESVSGVVASMGTNLGKVTVKAYSVDTTDTKKITLSRGNVAYTYADVDGTTSFDAKVKFSF